MTIHMADHLVWRGSGPTDDEQVVNTMPFHGQLEGRPERAFWGRLRSSETMLFQELSVITWLFIKSHCQLPLKCTHLLATVFRCVHLLHNQQKIRFGLKYLNLFPVLW